MAVYFVLWIPFGVWLPTDFAYHKPGVGDPREGYITFVFNTPTRLGRYWLLFVRLRERIWMRLREKLLVTYYKASGFADIMRQV